MEEVQSSSTARNIDNNDDDDERTNIGKGDTSTILAPLRMPQTNIETILASVPNDLNKNNHDRVHHSYSSVVINNTGEELSPQLSPTKPAFFSNIEEEQKEKEGGQEDDGDKTSLDSSSSSVNCSKQQQQQKESIHSGEEEEAKQGEEKVDLDLQHSSLPPQSTDNDPNDRGDIVRLSKTNKENETKHESKQDAALVEAKHHQQQQQQEKEEVNNEETPVNNNDVRPAQEIEGEGTGIGSVVGSPSPRRQQRQQQSYPVRLQPSAKSHASTEIVQSMFGPTVGQCWGDFSCQYNHVRGRLYASTEAVLFYSNLFGFEKKINLSYDDVLEMSLYRQTSIQVTVQDKNNNSGGNNSSNKNTNNNEGNNNITQEAAVTASTQYVFKGFSDRTQTLQLLIELWRQCQGVEGGNTMLQVSSEALVINSTDNHLHQLSPTRSLSPSSGSRMVASATAADPAAAATSASPTTQATTPVARPPSILKSSPQQKITTKAERSTKSANPMLPDIPSRKRSKSVPNLNRRRPQERRNSETSTSSTAATSSSSAAPPDEEDFDWNVTPTNNDEAAWQVAKQSAGAWVKEVGVEPVTLPCSLRTFYKLFLANDAEYSVDKYQRGEEVKDLDIRITPWMQDPSDTNTLVRTIDFRHPCGSFGVGPSHAPTKRRQQLRRYPGCGISMVSSTTVEGLPGSDCFVVEDHWLVEAVPTTNNGNNLQQQIQFKTLFGANFTKRTFLKSIIQKNIKSGSKDWYVGYKKMVQSAIKEKEHLLDEEQPPEEAPTSDDDDVSVQDPTAEVEAAVKCTVQDTNNESDLLRQLLLSPTGTMVLVAFMVLQVLLLLVFVFVVSELRTSQQTNQGLLEEMKLLRLEHGQVLGLLVQQQQPQQEQ